MNDFPKDLKIIDYDAALKNVSGKEAILRDMIQDLVNELIIESKNAKSLAQKKDRENLVMLTHKICGSANYCKMERLNFISRKITTALREKNYSDIAAQVTALQNAIVELLDEVNKKLNIQAQTL